MKVKGPLTWLLLAGCFFMQSASVAADRGLGNPLFAMSTGTDPRNLTPRQQARTLRELGYAGIGWTLIDVAEMLEALDANGLKMFTLYAGARIDDEDHAYDPRLPEAIRLLRGRDTIIWLALTSSNYPASSPKGDPEAVAVVREIADMAAESRLRVAIYPHHGAWVECIEDAVRVARQVDRDHVGVTFNLCHWLRASRGQHLKRKLLLARPMLFVVTINGADLDGSWDRLIQPLDRGSYDVFRVVRTLHDMGYRGPVGLQGYGIPGDARENLARSMAAWKAFSTRIAAERRPEKR